MPHETPKRNPERVDLKICPDGKVVVEKFWLIDGRYRPLRAEVKETRWEVPGPRRIEVAGGPRVRGHTMGRHR